MIGIFLKYIYDARDILYIIALSYNAKRKTFKAVKKKTNKQIRYDEDIWTDQIFVYFWFVEK